MILEACKRLESLRPDTFSHNDLLLHENEAGRLATLLCKDQQLAIQLCPVYGEGKGREFRRAVTMALNDGGKQEYTRYDISPTDWGNCAILEWE